MTISRRTFLESAAVAGLAGNALAAATERQHGMPQRTLGKTGARVSILGFGCGSRWLMYEEEDKAIEALSRALDAGVTYIDTAFNYGKGQSEQWVGRCLQGRRDDVWLATKIPDRTYDDFMRRIEASLKRLQTDQVDLLHMHNLRGAADLAAIEAPDGALKALYKVRDEKLAKSIGVTSHTDPAVLKTCLERHDLDCTQMALNAGLMGDAQPSNVRGYANNFERLALPVALKKKMGVTAMKVYAQEKLLPDATPQELVRYAMSLPVAAAVIGMPQLAHIDQNVSFAKNFRPLPDAEMKRLSSRLAANRKQTIDRYFACHDDCCDAYGRTS